MISSAVSGDGGCWEQMCKRFGAWIVDDGEDGREGRAWWKWYGEFGRDAGGCLGEELRLGWKPSEASENLKRDLLLIPYLLQH